MCRKTTTTEKRKKKAIKEKNLCEHDVERAFNYSQLITRQENAKIVKKSPKIYDLFVKKKKRETRKIFCARKKGKIFLCVKKKKSEKSQKTQMKKNENLLC